MRRRTRRARLPRGIISLLMCVCAGVMLSSTAIIPVADAAAAMVQIRQATAQDLFAARKTLFQAAMNPLSLSEQTLLVATSDDSDHTLGFGQIRSLDADYSELASLYIYPEHRHEGVGSALVAKLLERHDAATSTRNTKVCLLTLRPTIPFYQPHGFEVQLALDDLPQSIQFEHKAGSLVSSLLGNDICCMVRTTPDAE
jgi:ribosomal protein S18 acetylase RimI-like enzyme